MSLNRPEATIVIGVDFGTSGVRAIAVDAMGGDRLACAEGKFPRWESGEFCDESSSVYRQHPVELVEAFTGAIRKLVADLGDESSRVASLTTATTGSSPAAIGVDGLPLAFDPRFDRDPDALSILWKDHAAEEESASVEQAAEAGAVPYLSASDGAYSPEWFWSKVLRAVRRSPRVAAAASTWAEHSDWLPAFLCDRQDPFSWVRNRCGAAHKALWNSRWGGFPPGDFFARIDPALAQVRATLPDSTRTADHAYGTLAPGRAAALGLPPDTVVGFGVFDAHAAALGGGVGPGVVVKTIGTSSSDMVTVDGGILLEPFVRGVESQAEGSMIPGLLGVETGQSAYGDMFDWFRRLVSYGGGDVSLQRLEGEARNLPVEDRSPVVVDWFAGRRTPSLDASAQAVVSGLTLSTSAPRLYRSLVEGAAFGTRAIHDHLRKAGIPVDRIVLLGGIPGKSPLVVETLSDVLGMPVWIDDTGNSAALGAAILASVAAGVHPDVPAAQRRMISPHGTLRLPDGNRKAVYDRLYLRYRRFADVAGSIRSIRSGTGVHA